MKKRKEKKITITRQPKQSLSLSVQDVSVYKILYHRLKLLSKQNLRGEV